MTKLLLIDDDAPLRKILGLYLHSKGYDVIVAADSQKGIDLFNRERPPIVLTDIKMPGIGGIEVLRRIKQISPETEVIVITGHGDMALAIQSLQLNASDFILKPIGYDTLSATLERAKERLDTRRRLKEYANNVDMIKEATEELRKAHDFQQNLIQSSTVGIVAAEKAGTIVVFNRGAENLLDYTAHEVIGRMDMDRIYPAGVAETVNENLHSEAYGGKGRLVNYENILMSKTGEEIPVRISGANLFEDGAVTGMVCFFHDLREIKQRQKESIENERVSATGQAVAGMAHYIKNILDSLQDAVQIVNTSLKKNKPDLLPKGWTTVEKYIDKVSYAVTNMLIYSKEHEPDYAYCSPNDIAQNVCDVMKERAMQSKVRLEKDFDLSIDECYLDPDGLHRCLRNLVDNAIDACIFHTEKDKDLFVLIRTREEGGGIRIDIVDNGVGMTTEMQENLFEPFFTTKGTKGAGLGLLVTHKIIDEHGGTVSFESDPGKGTAFTIRFPGRRGKK